MSALLALTLTAFWLGDPAEAAPAGGTYQPLSPQRLFDTRDGAAVPGGGSVTYEVAGRAGVPLDSAAAVTLNVTVTRTTAPGHITIFPADRPQPTASNLNFVAGQTIANGVTVKLSLDGRITLTNGSTRPVHLIADVAGWYASGSATSAGAFNALTPYRILDTREGIGAGRAQIPANHAVTFQVAGVGGVPRTGVGAAVLNVTVTRTRAAGHITAYPSDGARPLASNLNFTAGQTIANGVTVKLSTAGWVHLANGSSQPVDLIVDVAGWYAAGTPTEPGAFVPLAPARLLDSREGVGAPAAIVPAGGRVSLQVTGRGGVPAGAVSAAALNITATRGSAGGHVTVHPSGEETPLASSLNFAAGQTIANNALVALSTDGRIDLVNGSTQPVHLIVDVAGYVVAATPPLDGGLTRVSVSTDGAQSDGFSTTFDITPDGRYVLFGSDATTIDAVAADNDERYLSLYRRDTLTGTTTLVSVARDGAWIDGYVEAASISDDGSVVAFSSDATNLVPGDENAAEDVFVRDLRSSTTTRAVVGSGTEFAEGAAAPVLSGDGSTVVFETYGTSYDLQVWNRQTDTVEGLLDDAAAYDDFGADVSSDGRYVAFVADTALVDHPGGTCVFRIDRATDALRQVCEDTQSTNSDVQISPDGQRVAFSNLSEGWPGTRALVRSLNFSGAALYPVPRPEGMPEDADMLVSTLAGDKLGLTVSWWEDEERTDRAVVFDLATVTHTVIHDGDGSNPALSAGAARVAFDSWDDDLVEDDTNDSSDVFVGDLHLAR